ncbi:MAG: riboflavin synthase subunit alpha [Lentisphaerae bacterium GWF2_45_14]|nr:MAG: riboflavin synthase subunit alpha [Lentisphaerae bacterium GWF2_45_14]
MFTGLVLTTADVKSRRISGASGVLKLSPAAKLENLEKGESIAVNGACLTLENEESGILSFHVLSETFKRTNLGEIPIGAVVNIERAMSSGSRFGGHIVQGHVDTVSKILYVGKRSSDIELKISLADELQPFLIEKGSIAIDGISLTLVKVGKDFFSVRIIPHTWNETNLRFRKPGDFVNIETDLFSKYIHKQLSALNHGTEKKSIDMETLRNAGW